MDVVEAEKKSVVDVTEDGNLAGFCGEYRCRDKSSTRNVLSAQRLHQHHNLEDCTSLHVLSLCCERRCPVL